MTTSLQLARCTLQKPWWGHVDIYEPWGALIVTCGHLWVVRSLDCDMWTFMSREKPWWGHVDIYEPWGALIVTCGHLWAVRSLDGDMWTFMSREEPAKSRVKRARAWTWLVNCWVPPWMKQSQTQLMLVKWKEELKPNRFLSIFL
jgi:hypothetical protein